MSPRKPLRILALLPSHLMCYRHLQIGIANFAQMRRDWHVDFHPPDSQVMEYVSRTQPVGLIPGPTRNMEPIFTAIRQTRHAVSLCAGNSGDAGFETMAEVGVDDVQVGVLGAQHLLSKGFQSFAFLGGPKDAVWSEERLVGFTAEVRSAGYTASVFRQPWSTTYDPLECDEDDPTRSLSQWLEALPKPAALMACNDMRARELAQLCEDLGLHVPEEIAILGVDNDDLDCRLSRPPLSSVLIPWERLGYRAAELLERQSDGQPVEPGLHKMPATSIVERQSTDVIAVADADVRAALNFIRTNASRPITVDDVINSVPLSRRDLEQRFRKLLQRSPLEEIRAAHLSRAKTLLATSDMSIDDVALQSGFASVHWFDKVFKRFAKCTPSSYRRKTRSN